MPSGITRVWQVLQPIDPSSTWPLRRMTHRANGIVPSLATGIPVFSKNSGCVRPAHSKNTGP